MFHRNSQISMRPLGLNLFSYTCRLHICDMFEKIPAMASRVLVKGLFKYLHLHHCFPIIFLLGRYHSFLGSDLGSGPKKVAQIPGTLTQNWEK